MSADLPMRMRAEDSENETDEEELGGEEEGENELEEKNNKKRLLSRRNQRRQYKMLELPPWNRSQESGVPPSPMLVTQINHTQLAIASPDVSASFNEKQSSDDWLKNHSIESKKLTLKDLLAQGTISRTPNAGIHDQSKHLQFEAATVNEFEYHLHMTIEQYHNRIKWLMQGSKKMFGLIQGSRVAVMVDSSDANCGFGRLSNYQDALLNLIDEQLHSKDMLYLMSFGSEIDTLWEEPRISNFRILNEVRNWVNGLRGLGGCNLLRALKKIVTVKDVDSIVLVLGNVPDQDSDILVDYAQQLLVGLKRPLHTVAFDCSNYLTNMTLRKLSEASGGRYHVYASSCEEQIYTGSDIACLLKEIKRTQDVLNKIKEMRQGMMGDALISILNEISMEVQKLPASRFLPRPPNHTGPLVIQEPRFMPKTSYEWLKNHGLKAKKLNLYQVLAPNAFAPVEQFIPVLRKSVSSTVHEKAMTQFEWHDGTTKNIHVDPAMLYDYQKKLDQIVKLYEKRVDWLASDSRRIFGTLSEKNIIILVDVAMTNSHYLVHIQHSLRLLLEDQMVNHERFNVIAFGKDIQPWKSGMQETSIANLQSCWKWILGLECSGSRNLMGALRTALESEEDRKRDLIPGGIYLFTSGVQDQMPDVVVSFLQESAVGENIKLHSVLFNTDDYDRNGAIPGRYANITETADILRDLAHVTGGRFHWFRDSGIIESDDVTAVLAEIDKAVNYSQKCAMLVDSVKRKSDQHQLQLESYEQMKLLPIRPSSGKKRLQQTNNGMAKLQITDGKEKDVQIKALPWRPTSAAKNPDNKKSQGTKKSNKPTKEVFYTEQQNQVGVYYKQYPNLKKKSVRKSIKHPIIPDREDTITSKEWLKKYGLAKLKLDLEKLVSGPDCAHEKKKVGTLHKTVTAKYCSIFPSVNIKGTVKHLQLKPHEVHDYEEQLNLVLRRYFKRLHWLMSGSRRIFGTVVEKNVAILVDTSGSMISHMEVLKKELVSLIWDQLNPGNIRFNIIRFSGDVEQMSDGLVSPTDENCHKAVHWTSTFVPGGNTCTLEALVQAFQMPSLDAIYLLTDGKPDSSTSLVLREVARLNTIRAVKIHTISFNCENEVANTFLKQLAAMSRARYHRVYTDTDGHLVAHKLISDGFQDATNPSLPAFEGDDLRLLAAEIAQTRQYLQQTRSFYEMYDKVPKPHERELSALHESCLLRPDDIISKSLPNKS